jgi:hypothetical protein
MGVFIDASTLMSMPKPGASGTGQEKAHPLSERFGVAMIVIEARTPIPL